MAWVLSCSPSQVMTSPYECILSDGTKTSKQTYRELPLIGITGHVNRLYFLWFTDQIVFFAVFSFDVYCLINFKHSFASYQNINSSFMYYMYIHYKWSNDMEICNKIEYSIKGHYDAKQQMSSRRNKNINKKRSKTSPTLLNGFINDILDVIDQSCDLVLYNQHM